MLRIGYFVTLPVTMDGSCPSGEPLDHNFVGKLDAISKR
jgi:hypothetical protein